MGTRVQRWADKHFGWAVVVVMAFIVGVGAAGIVWVNSTDPSLPAQVTTTDGRPLGVGDTVTTLGRTPDGACDRSGGPGGVEATDVSVTLRIDTVTCRVSVSGIEPVAPVTDVARATPLGLACQHKNTLDMTDQVVASRVFEAKVTAYWATSGITGSGQCTGGAVYVSSAYYWCSWMGSLGYLASCSVFWHNASNGGSAYAETVMAANAQGIRWQELVEIKMIDRYGHTSYYCSYEGYHDPAGDGIIRCTLTRQY